MIILGISAYYHDSAASIIKDGEIIAAAQEERFTRIKGDNSFPHNAINFCLNSLNITINDVDSIVFYENPLIKFERLLISYYTTVPKGITSFLSSIPKWASKNLFLESVIAKELGIKKEIQFSSHHLSHAASAFYPSPYKKSMILTIDGVGEWSTTTYGIGENNKIKLLKEINFPNSLGLLYSTFTSFLGFKINFDEYKVMGLAPYGEPKYVDIIKDKLIKINDDGSIILNQKYFKYTYGLKMYNKQFIKLFGKPRKKEAEITKRDMDLARSIQEITDEVIIKMCKHIKKELKCDNLVLAGGVALNVVSVGKIEKECGLNVWIQPASGDAGGAIGASLWYYYDILNNERIVDKIDSMKYCYLGYEINNIDKLKEYNAIYEEYEYDELISKISNYLKDNKVVAIARGKMEWGPRALGNRSILASCLDPKMQSKLNLKIKKRESFRPFAPIVLESDKNLFFDMDKPSYYMSKIFYVKENLRIKTKKENNIIDIINQKRSIIPSVTHIDYTSRVQTVNRNQNEFMYDLLNEYKKLTGYGILINTSFNVRGEPIVCDEVDAFKCFMNTDIDYLVIGNKLFDKSKQKNGSDNNG